MPGSGRPWLVLGGTGLLGARLVRQLRTQGQVVETVARQNADHQLDLTDGAAVQRLLTDTRPSVVINCAAMVSLAACEAEPDRAQALHSDLVRVLTEVLSPDQTRLVHISTDHIYAGEGAAAHTESSQIQPYNIYAKTKLSGESFALGYSNVLIFRTNFTSAVKHNEALPFGAWVLKTAREQGEITGFADAYCSLLDVETAAKAILEAAVMPITGLYNLGASDVFSKLKFIQELLKQAEVAAEVKTGTVAGLVPPRVRAGGMDSRKLQAHLPWSLPNLNSVCAQLVAEETRHAI